MHLSSLGKRFWLTICLAVVLAGCGGPNFFPAATVKIVPTIDFERERKVAERIATELGFARSPSKNEGRIFNADFDDPYRVIHFYRLPHNTKVAIYTRQDLTTGTLLVTLADSSIGGLDFQGDSKTKFVQLVRKLREEFGDDRVKLYEKSLRQLE